jgi:DNA-binding NarL/FixJ family response regulator
MPHGCRRRHAGAALSPSPPIRILIADDHPLFRAGIAAVVGCQDDMRVVGEAGSGTEAVELCRSVNPDVVLMDLQMPEMDGLSALTAIRQQQPDVRILVVTTYGGDVQASRALRLGASAYLLKDTLRGALVDAIRSAVAPTPPASSNPPASGNRANSEPLTDRELALLRQVALARSNDEIAAALVLSPSVVKAGIRSILLKLNANDRTHAVVIAIKRGIIVV